MLKNPERFVRGYILSHFDPGPETETWLQNQSWPLIDEAFKKKCAPSGELFHFLKNFHDFNSIEFILSIRDAEDPDQEDGIWHDDGSRFFSFSLSLTEGEVEGGVLGIRSQDLALSSEIPTPPYGGMILFLTGHYGFEHQIKKVTRGRRVVIAGWCS